MALVSSPPAAWSRSVDGVTPATPPPPPVPVAGEALATSRTPLCFGRVPTIVGTEEGDILIGTPGTDVIVGLGGGDLIYGLGGRDFICAGTGDDVVLAGRGKDRIKGEGGGDLLFGERGIDHIGGGTGVDGCKGEKTHGCETQLSTRIDVLVVLSADAIEEIPKVCDRNDRPFYSLVTGGVYPCSLLLSVQADETYAGSLASVLIDETNFLFFHGYFMMGKGGGWPCAITVFAGCAPTPEIDPPDFYFRVVQIALTSYVGSNDGGTDLGRLSTKGDGYMDDIDPLLDEYRADLVLLFTGFGSGTCNAYVPGPPGSSGNSGSGFATCGAAYTLDYAADNGFDGAYGVAHELAHTLGALHKPVTVEANILMVRLQAPFVAAYR